MKLIVFFSTFIHSRKGYGESGSFAIFACFPELPNYLYTSLIFIVVNLRFYTVIKPFIEIQQQGDDSLLGKSVVILAGGSSSRIGQQKGLLLLAGKPLIIHVLDAVHGIVGEKIIVVSSKAQAKKFGKIVGSDVRVAIDTGDLDGPLVGALNGFKHVRGEYSLLLPCDIPLASTQILSYLLEICKGKNAVVPRWPNGYLEPLQAVYRTKPAIEAAEKTLSQGKLKIHSMIDELRSIRYISTLVLQQLDPKLRTFFNINTSRDLKKAESMYFSPNPYSNP